MTALSDKVKVALDETRMLILGSQILIGFQFRAVFQDNFAALPERTRQLDGVGLGLMLAVLACLIAPGLHHRIVERGRDSARLHHFTSAMAGLALFPFACSLGLDVFIALDSLLGRLAALIAGCAFGGLALFWWYGFEILRMRSIGLEERLMSSQRAGGPEHTPLHTRIDQMLTEARVILPGAQALLGFQLAIVISRSFDELSPVLKLWHAASLGLMTLTVILLMAPAAYHRIVYAGEDNEEFHRTGSLLVTAATIPLALGLGCDVYVVMTRIFASPALGAAVGLVATCGFVVLWYIYPGILRLRGGGARRNGSA